MIVERIKKYDTMKPNNKITKNKPKMQKPSSTLQERGKLPLQQQT